MKVSYRNELFSHVREKYGTEPEYPWISSPDTAVLRHSDNNKWYGIVMPVSGYKLNPELGDEVIDVINVKADPVLIGALRMNTGYYPAFHMNKDKWISIALDGTVSFEEICTLIDASFELTNAKPKSKTGKRITDWIIPSNPKIYDIVEVFECVDEVLWTRSANISVGDNIYLYVGAPYSAIMYKCVVTELTDKITTVNGRQKQLMKIRLLKKYPREFFNREILVANGVRAVRGPRSIPSDLIRIIEEMTE